MLFRSGHVRGYVSGIVDGEFSGVIDGIVNAQIEAGAVSGEETEVNEKEVKENAAVK